MARETVYRCDACGEYTDKQGLVHVLMRPVTATTQDYKNGAELCPACRATVTVARVMEIAAERRAADDQG